MLEKQLNETRVRKQMEISELDGRLSQDYERKLEESLSVTIIFNLYMCMCTGREHF